MCRFGLFHQIVMSHLAKTFLFYKLQTQISNFAHKKQEQRDRPYSEELRVLARARDNDNFCLEMTIARLMWTRVSFSRQIMLRIMGSKLDIEWLSNMQTKQPSLYTIHKFKEGHLSHAAAQNLKIALLSLKYYTTQCCFFIG